VEKPSLPPVPGNAPTAGIDAEVIGRALLAVVSEKTGYPVETLEPDMDMEADLGIDSIKRVEILGAMQTQFPELPKADAAALAELRTLRQITEYLSAAPAELPKSPRRCRLRISSPLLRLASSRALWPVNCSPRPTPSISPYPPGTSAW